jgi:hypothetical protein
MTVLAGADVVERARDLREIEVLKYRYARLIDLKRWDELGSCFTPDAVAVYDDGRFRLEGRDTIVAWLAESLPVNRPSLHMVAQPEISFTGPDSARASWALRDEVIDVASDVTIRGASFYDDSYRLVEGAWYIDAVTYVRVYEEMVSRRDGRVLRLRFLGQEGGTSR